MDQRDNNPTLIKNVKANRGSSMNVEETPITQGKYRYSELIYSSNIKVNRKCKWDNMRTWVDTSQILYTFVWLFDCLFFVLLLSCCVVVLFRCFFYCKQQESVNNIAVVFLLFFSVVTECIVMMDKLILTLAFMSLAGKIEKQSYASVMIKWYISYLVYGIGNKLKPYLHFSE